MSARVSASVLVTAVLAALVTAAALFGAWALRTPSDTARMSSGVRNDACVRGDCPVLATAAVEGGVARLRATRDGRQGALSLPGGDRLRVTITDVGARLSADSLRCVHGGAGAASCLVRGSSAQGEVGEVFVDQQGSWERVERPYVSSAGVLQLRQLDGASTVVAVQRDCDTGSDCASDAVYAQAFDVSGRDLGCTQVYDSKYSLPGWPRVTPSRSLLGDCPRD